MHAVGMDPNSPRDTCRAVSQQEREVVRAFVEAWNRRDFDAALKDTHEDVELHFIGGFAEIMGTEWKGRDGLRRFWREWFGTIGGRIELERTLEAGGRVVVIGTIEARGVASGAPSSLRFGQVWSFRDGKVVRVDGYNDPRSALSAVGLPEQA
jgi:ketosteroid isomerase-like protein